MCACEEDGLCGALTDFTPPPPVPRAPLHACRRVYAYEVDGLGNALVGFDDPNLPSLLAMPLLGFEGYEAQVGGTSRPVARESA